MRPEAGGLEGGVEKGEGADLYGQTTEEGHAWKKNQRCGQR